MTKNTEKKNVSEIITDRFVKALEGGQIPWVRPWELWTSWSRNTGDDYQGVNQLTLSGGEYVTFKQAKAEGITINKGAKSEMIVKYTEYMRTISAKDAEKHAREIEYYDRTGRAEHLADGRVKIPARSIKYYNVFNIETCTNGEKKHDKQQQRHTWDAIEKADEIAGRYIKAAGIAQNDGSNKAFYTMLGHDVTLPRREQFKSAEAFYSTMFHELVHSTWNKAGRTLEGYHKSKQARAREELVAEIGAAYIMSYLGIETSFTIENSNAYVKDWAGYLKNDANAILYAAPQAIKAAEMIIKAAA